MKKIIKNFFLFTVIILYTIYPSNIFAEQTSYVNINNTQSLEVENLSFTNISFKDYSSTSTRAFGLTGTVNNSSNKKIDYISTIYYYDSNYNLITQTNNIQTAVLGSRDFNQMSNLSILNGYDVDEIYYYRLSIEITDASSSKNTILNPSKNSLYSSYDYVIDKYDINITVNENNTFDITETITAYFNTEKNGIIRTIPLQNTITRLDGTTSTNHAQITNVSVDNEYKISRENGNYKIKIGSENKTFTGIKNYTIKYTYNLGKDPVNDYDELYYNIIGNGWDTVIGNVTFTITMPKEFDSSKLGFSSGLKGSTDNSNIKYNVVGNKITGSYNGILEPSEALTIRCELPEGYFVGAGLTVNTKDYIYYIIPIIFLVISILLWYKYGRDDQVIETVEFYPPQGFNSLEVGFLYKGKAVDKDVISLLIYLANKGYIKISETEDKVLFIKNKGFKITKLKEYDGDNINEKLFLKGLFTKTPVVSIKALFDKNYESPSTNINEVTSTDLYDNFYITMNKILTNINDKENKNKIFEKSSSNKRIFIILMMIIAFCLITIPPILLYGGSFKDLMFAILFPGIGFTVLAMLVFGKTSISQKLFGLIWGLGFGGVPMILILLPTLMIEPTYLIGYGVGIICIIGMAICLKYLSKRTSYGNEIFGKLKGFKNFLETAEKERLEAMVMENPTYFYDILPYTYVLGVSDKWIKKFESISLQAPSWYDSPNTFNFVSFGSFINSTMASAESAMSSSSSSSDSGGSSGGGSSGGGSGGGGGSSW